MPGLIAQSVEQGIENPRVGGSIPPQATTQHRVYFQYGLIAQSVEQGIENPRVGGSIPPQATTLLSKFSFSLANLNFRHGIAVSAAKVRCAQLSEYEVCYAS